METEKSSATENTSPDPCERNIKNEQDRFLAPVYDKDEKWVKEHIEQFGEEPSFF